VRVADLNWQQVEEYLAQDDRVVLPVGSTEQHAYLSLATDSILAERIAVEAADSYRLELENLSDAIRGEGSPLLGRADALGQVRTIEALYRSAETGQRVEL
jgi:predicted dehydrogenase